MPGTSSWQLRDGEKIIACNTSLFGQKHFLIGITRVRNEALILRDTLDYVGKHVDAIVAYDDASTDRTLEILGGHPKVALIVTNRSWEADIEARRIAEGRHRGLLLQTARGPATTTCDTFRSIPTDENGSSAKVEQSTPNLTSCDPCTSGVTRSSRMRSRCDLSENRTFLPPRATMTAWLKG